MEQGGLSVFKQVMVVVVVGGDVFNACFILCFLRREKEDNARPI